MGITGLIPFLEKASTKTNIKEFANQTCAVDTYCWLHKGVFGCAERLIRGEETDIYVQYCLKFVNLLLSYNIKPILVFDGRHLPAKAETEKRRRENRQQAKKRAGELMRLGKIDEARSQMRRSIDVTHEMALKLIKECREKNVDCIVAPYEADAQLAYLNKIKLAQYVITEDSDLILFGCQKILFKFDLNGNCLLVDANKLNLAMGCRVEKYSFDKFRQMCILSGCDYLDSLHGIGLVKACKFILKTEETDMKKLLKKIPQYLNMRQLVVNDDYIEDFLKAEACFKYMYVFDPIIRKQVRLNEIPNDSEIEYCSNAGKLLDDDRALQLALGNINPFTLQQLDDWHPDELPRETRSKSASWKNKSKAKHKSIWDPDYKRNVPKQMQIEAFQFKKIHYKVDEDIPVENDEEKEINIISLYDENISTLGEMRSRKRKCSDSDVDIIDIEENKRHNPFVKIPLQQLSQDKSPKKNIISPENKSFLSKIISPSEKKEKDFKANITNETKKINVEEKKMIKSRFFYSNPMLLKNSKENLDDLSYQNQNIEESKHLDANQKQNEKIIEEIERIQTEYKNKSKVLYSPEKITVSEINEDELNATPKNENTVRNSECSSPNSDVCDELDKIIDSNKKFVDIGKSHHMLLQNFEFDKNKKSLYNNDIIELSDSETIKPDSKLERSRKIIRLGLKKKKNSKIKKSADPVSQTCLSMFGFQKKTLIKNI